MIVITPLGSFLNRTVELLREMIGRHAVRHRALAPMILLVWTRLNRLRHRFERLVLLWERDRLPTPRPRAPRARAPRPRPELRLPTGHAWLLKLVPLAGAFSAHIEALLIDADVQALAAATPRAGRILRPLARMFGLPLPEYLRLAPRPRKPRTPRPRPPRPESRTALLRRLRGMTGAELRAFFHPMPPHFPLPIPGLRAIRRKMAQE